MKKLSSVLALVLAFLLCIGMLAGCNKPAENTPSGNGGEQASSGDEGQSTTDDKPLAGEYDVKVWVAEAAVELTKQQIEDYNNTNEDGIKINATVEPVGEGEAATSMVQDVEAGADVFCFAQDQAARLIQAGALSKLGVQAAEKVTSENAAGVVAAATSDGELYAYPLTADNGYFLYYDKSVIPDADVDSLEKIIADCEAAGKLFSFELEGSAWYTAGFFFGAGCTSVWSTDAEGQFTGCADNFNSDLGLIAAKGMQKLLLSPAYYNSSAGVDFSAATPSAAVVTGTWDFEAVKAILGDNLGVADLPSFEVDGQEYHIGSFSGCKLLGVKPQVDAKKSAALHKFAQYLTGEKAQMERFEALSWGPANLVDQQAEAVQANPGLAALLAQAPYSVPQGQIHGSWWDIGKALATNIKEAADEDGIKAALTTYKAAIDALFGLSEAEKRAFSVIGTCNLTDGFFYTDYNNETRSNWVDDIPMIEVVTGTWKTTQAYEMEAGVEFKVRQGKSWDVAFGDGDANFKVEEAGTYFIEFVYDEAAGTGAISLVTE